MRLGVFLPNWIGDVVMATPALRSLRRLAGPKGTLLGVMRPYVADVLAGQPWFDQTILSGKNRRDAATGSAAVIEQLREARLDRIVLLTNSLRTAWLAWRSKTPERVGVARDLRGPLLTTKLYEPRRGRRIAPLPTIDSYLQVAFVAGGPWEPPRMELATTSADEAAADQVWRKLNLPSGEEVVVLNSGGAFGAAKSWPIEHFAALAQRIVADHGLHVLVNCGPAERDAARQIVAQADSPQVASLADFDVPLGLSKAAIRRARLLVTTDSGPRFFGVAFGKPVVTLFGPTDPTLTNTHSPLEQCLSLELDCQPCWQRSCPLKHHRCLRDLTVDRVAAAVRDALAADVCPPAPSRNVA
ncbi:MAG: lipopolysaccharide heptosyltransferase II [Planctomycetaceae bacterium]|nr:lipopolysaccharide heptosyltransferase II [Planctomycetaceae bacterium]